MPRVCPECPKKFVDNRAVCDCGFEFVIQEFDRTTRGFALMYDDVTHHLIRWLFSPGANLQQNEIIWFMTLITRFWRNYRSWQTGPAPMIEYLNRFKQRSCPGSLRVVAHAYLHIAYDLPRDIATTLLLYSAELAAPQPPVPIPLSRMSPIYLQQNPSFQVLAERHARLWKMSGMLAVVARAVPRRMSLYSTTVGNWIIALRSVAFIHAEILAHGDPHTRAALEARLIKAVNDASKDVVRSRFNPVSWPSKLSSPLLLSVALPIDVVLTRNVLPLGAAILLLLLAWASFAYLRLIYYADRLGEAVYIRVNEAMQGRD